MSESAPLPQVFTLGCTPLGKFADRYRNFLAKKNLRPRFWYTADKARPVDSKADVYLVETVSVFAAVKDKLNPNAITIVADSPLLLAELPSAYMADTTVEGMWRMKLHEPNLSLIDKARKHHKKHGDSKAYVKYPVEKVDVLGLIIDKVSGGNILSSMNAIMFQLSAAQRHLVRRELFRYLSGQIAVKALAAAIINHAGSSLSTYLSSSIREMEEVFAKKGPVYREGVALLQKGKSAETFAKRKKVSLFELRFLSKIVSQFNPDKKRKAGAKNVDPPAKTRAKKTRSK